MKNVATGILCSLLCALTACGGGGSSGGKPKSSSSIALSSSSVAVSSTALSSTPASSSGVVSSAALSSAPASSAGVVVSSAALSSTPASSAGVVVSSTAPSSAPASSVASSVVVSSVASSAASVALSSSANSSSAPVAAQVGVFVDSAVAGVSYVTTPGGFSGVTSATGQYEFAAGDTVAFSIGAIEFPPVTAKGVVTPVDMADSGDAADPIVINIAVLLQSLDVDGDPSNGISIPAAAVAAAVQNVDFDQPYSSFAAEVLPVVQHTDSGKPVVTELAATTHLEASLAQVNSSLLLGTWYIETESFRYALFILDETHYASVDSDMEVDDSAMVSGTYEWDQVSKKITLSNVIRTDSDLDARPPMADGNTLVLNGNTLTLADDGSVDGEEATFELHRLVGTAEKPLKGGWSISEEGALVVFAFTDTHYLMGQQSEVEPVGWPGAEIGTYEHNVETGAVVVNTLADSNGQWGISHSCAVLDKEGVNDLSCGPEGRDIVQTFNVTGDTLTFVSEADTIADDQDNDEAGINGNGEEQPNYFDRVLGVPDGDTHVKLEVTVTYLEYVPGEAFSHDGGNATMQCNMKERPRVDSTEITRESWVLGGTLERPSWTSTLPAHFNPETNKLTFDIREPVTPVEGNEYFSTQFWESLDATYNAEGPNVITGTYTEGYDLTWERDDDVSSCKLVYSVKGVLR